MIEPLLYRFAVKQGLSLSKNLAKDFRDGAAGECEGAKSPPRIKLKPRKWLISAIFSILRYSKCVGQIAKKSQRDFFDDLSPCFTVLR